MIALTIAAIAARVGGRLHLANGVPDSALVDGPVVTDSREAGPGSLYVARRGEHEDGHRYLRAAHDRGAVLALIEQDPALLPSDTFDPALSVIVVEDSQLALGQVANLVLAQRPDLQVVAITGSSGKTSTKDLLAEVLRTDGPTVAPENSYNGEIGVPLTVCRIEPTTRHLVLEMGARGIGHLRYLTGIARPAIAIVLNVGSAHIGEFGGPGATAAAKGELVEALGPDGVAILNADDPAVAAMAQRTVGRVVLVGRSEGADIRATDVRTDPLGRPTFVVTTAHGRARISLALHGEHHVDNALAVVAAGLALGLSLDHLSTALAGARAVSRWRMQVLTRPDGVVVVNDAYNANPESMRAGLTALAAMRADSSDGPDAPTRRIAVLGGMLELGEQSEALHAGVGQVAGDLEVDLLVAVGPLATAIAAGARAAGMPGDHVHEVADAEAAYDLLHGLLRRGDIVLFKSSRDSGLRWLGDRIAADPSGGDSRGQGHDRSHDPGEHRQENS